MWERKIVLRAGLVEILEINIDSQLAILFGNRDDIGQPLRVLDHWQKSDTELFLDLLFHLQAPMIVQSSQLLLNRSGLRQKWQVMLDYGWIKVRHVLIRPCKNIQIWSKQPGEVIPLICKQIQSNPQVLWLVCCTKINNLNVFCGRWNSLINGVRIRNRRWVII